MAAALVFHTRARSTAVWPTLGLLACVGLGPSVRAAEAAEPQPLRVISGVVLRAEDGTPIADATVLPEGHDDSPWREAFDSRPVATDREGRFRLPIQAGTSRIAVFAPGYEAITLDAEENRQSGFVLRREARRTLQVVDRQGRGIPGVQLHLLWGSSALRDAADLPRPVVRGVTASARCARPTDSQGRTELRHMPPDAVVTLTLRDQPWILTTPPRVRELDVAGSSRHEPVVLQAEPAGSVEGRAVDASGEPLAGWVVRLVGPESLPITHLTGAQGEFRFQGLPAGKVKVTCHWPVVGNRLEMQNSTIRPEDLEVTLAPGERKTGLALVLPQGAAIRARVVDAATGRPLPGVGLAPTSTGCGTIPIFRTDRNGAITVVYPPGPYKWRLVAPEDTYLTDTRVGGARPSLLKAGDVLDLGELRVTLRKRVRLLGRVVWADGTPAPGARVDWGYDLRGPLVLGAGPRVAGLDGRFTIEQFFDSSRWSKIQLQASHQGYCSPDGQDVRLAGRSGTEEVTLILGQRRLATVHGRLLDPHGRPVPNAGVAVGGYDGARWSPSIKTDREGRFTAECWPDRTYRFYGLAEGFGGARTKPVHLRGGVSRLPPLVLPPLSESLRLKVVAPNSRPAGEAVVDFVRGGRSQHEEPWQVGLAYLSDAEGRLELEGLAAGKYPIEIRYQGLVFRATAQTGAGTQTVRLRRAIRRLPADRGPRIEDVYVE